MKNRVTVTIAGQEYTLVGTEEASYTEKVAAHVDAKVEEVLSGAMCPWWMGPSWRRSTSPTSTSRRWRPRRTCAASSRSTWRSHQDEAGAVRAKREIFKLQNKK